ncbi:MAG TPA: 2'-5' RNA ligase family protein, partial [Casimicrobiaceae bacterium]|nr:2'-5' RNA ligase family protein [Casimicrobiaceae bacterium]
MRRRRPPPRPAFPRRALVWLLPDEAFDATVKFRLRYDPTATRIAPHVTLVFPFESTLGDVQIQAHVGKVVARWPAIPVRFEGFGHFHNDWVYRRITRGHEALLELHDRLYRGALAPFLRMDLPYEPHLTIARASMEHDVDALIATAKAALPRADEALMNALTLCRIDKDGTSHPIARVALGNA